MRLITLVDEPEFKGGRRKRSIRFGWEDIVLGVALLILVIGYWRGQLETKEALGYLGFTASGGVWGLLSARERKP